MEHHKRKKLTPEQLEKRYELIDRFNKWFSVNPNKSIVAAQCATIAQEYAAKEIEQSLEDIAEIVNAFIYRDRNHVEHTEEVTVDMIKGYMAAKKK